MKDIGSHSPLNFKTGVETTWKEDLLFYVGGFILFTPIWLPFLVFALLFGKGSPLHV